MGQVYVVAFVLHQVSLAGHRSVSKRVLSFGQNIVVFVNLSGISSRAGPRYTYPGRPSPSNLWLNFECISDEEARDPCASYAADRLRWIEPLLERLDG